MFHLFTLSLKTRWVSNYAFLSLTVVLFKLFIVARENKVCFSLLQVEKNSADFNLPTVVHRFLNRCYCILP